MRETKSCKPLFAKKISCKAFSSQKYHAETENCPPPLQIFNGPSLMIAGSSFSSGMSRYSSAGKAKLLRLMQTDATSHNIVACCWGFWILDHLHWSKSFTGFKVYATTCQHGRNMLGPTMLRPFAWRFSLTSYDPFIEN